MSNIKREPFPNTYQNSHEGSLLQGDEETKVKQSRPRILTTLIVCLIVIIVVLSIILGMEVAKRPGPTPAPEPIKSDCSRPPAVGSRAMISTTHFHATEAGLSILRAGGNAADAAAAIQFMLTVVQPQSTGIGGGCFVLIRDAGGHTFALDGREEAPARFNSTSFCKNETCKVDANCSCDSGAWPFNESQTGGHPVGVPGVISAMARLLKDHGTMTFAQTMQPAIERARQGFVMYQELYDRIMFARDRLLRYDASRELYLSGDGDMPIPVGQVLKNPDLADTFEWLATNQEQGFYHGELAKDIVDAVHNARNNVTGLAGVMEASDLANYTAVYRPVVQSTYNNHTILGFPPPSAGGLSLALMLAMLEPMKISEMAWMGTDYLHRLLDAQNLAFSDRPWLADADFVDVPAAMFLNKTYAQIRVSQFMRIMRSAQAAYGDLSGSGPIPLPLGPMGPSPPGLDQLSARHGTTHLVVVDDKKNMVSMTTTIENNMGCGVVVPKRGFLLNNELTDFTDLPANPLTGIPYANAPSGERGYRRTALGSDNTTVGGKRPLSSMTPTIVLGPDGNLLMGLGSPGGSRIIGSVLNGLLPLIDYKRCVTDATDVPRAIARNQANGSNELEAKFATNYSSTVTGLLSRGFNLRVLMDGAPLSFVEAVVLTSKGWEGSADIRNSVGSAEGY